MATTEVDIEALVTAAVEASVAVADAAEAEEYSTSQEAEAAINAARTAIQSAIDGARSEMGNLAFPVVDPLKALAAQLLQLRGALVSALQTREVQLEGERSLMDLALELYPQDEDVPGRAEELRALNPWIRNPLRIPAGTTVLAYVE